MKESSEILLSAIRDCGAWLPRFNKKEYESAFQEYDRQYGHWYRRAIIDADGDLNALAENLLNELESGWKSERFWGRASRRFEEKSMVICYLAPMLLENGDQDFADILKNAWNRRWPKNKWDYVSWRELKDGFPDKILGFPISSSRRK